MPDRVASPSPPDALALSGFRMIDGTPDEGDVADPLTRQGQAPSSISPVEAVRFDRGNLAAGGVASVSLLLLVFALDLTLWLAIPLAVATYAGVTLLRPRRVRPATTTADVGPEHLAHRPTTPDHKLIESADTVTTIVGTPSAADASGSAATVGLATAQFGLTRREIEILPLLAQRLTDREIAERLCISPRTAMNHTASILAKLELTSRREVADFAARHGLLPLAAPPKPGG